MPALLLWLFLIMCYPNLAEGKVYPFKNDPIDVVIPAAKKDMATLEYCIAAIKKYGHQVRHVYVVSADRYTTNAKWCDEKKFPFTKFDVALNLHRGNAEEARRYMNEPHSRVGWYYQQLLKFYAPLIIKKISSNVLILDADTIFLHPVTFLNGRGGGQYNPGVSYHDYYFVHMKNLLPDSKQYGTYSGISHHMLFQRPVLKDLFFKVEQIHQAPFWKVFCQCVNPDCLRSSGASEYEIYFSFVFSQTNQVSIRNLKWKNVPPIQQVGQKGLLAYQKKGYDYVSCHQYDFK